MKKDERYFSNIDTEDELATVTQDEVGSVPDDFPLVMRFTIIDSKYGHTTEREKIRNELERIARTFRIALENFSYVAKYSSIIEVSDSPHSLCFEIGVKFVRERFIYAYRLPVELENFIEQKDIVFLDASLTGKLPESNKEIPEHKLFIGYAEKKIFSERGYSKTSASKTYSKKSLNNTELYAYDELIRSVSNHSDIPLEHIISEINSIYFRNFDILNQFLIKTHFKKENEKAFEIEISHPENASLAEELRQIIMMPGFISYSEINAYAHIVADIKDIQERKIRTTTERKYVAPNYEKEPFRWFCTIESNLGVDMFRLFGYFGTRYFCYKSDGIFTSALVVQVSIDDSSSWKSLKKFFPKLNNFRELKKFAKKFRKEHFEPEFTIED